jgi:hypothetical protein
MTINMASGSPEQTEEGRERQAVVSNYLPIVGRARASRREPKSCLGQLFNFKLGCFCKECNGRKSAVRALDGSYPG